MLLGYLIFAHLLGDFVLQPSKLVRWKVKSKTGMLVHVLIHFLVNTLVLLPFFLAGQLWLFYVIFILSFVHFWIDEVKISYDLNHDDKVSPFILDQVLHLLTIMLTYFFVNDYKLELPYNSFNLIYSDIRILFFFSFIIFVSKGIEVYRFQKQREKNKKAKFHPNSDRMISRVIILSALFALFMFLSFYGRGIQFV